jgi:GNAT superfamily N-acetyltransferase
MAVNCCPHIRAAELADSREIARLSVTLNYPVTRADVESRPAALGKFDRAYAAVASGPQSTLIGWVSAEHRSLRQSAERVEITGLIVDPLFRRKGIGKAPVSAVEERAISKKLCAVTVRSNIARRESHDFYAEIGFERTKTQHCYAKILSSI